MASYEKGIILGSDKDQEWLLPWWWKHYSQHNSYPVCVVDFGMSQAGITWCQKRGLYLSLPPGPALKPTLSSQQQEEWETLYGKGIWEVRAAWLKKPRALLLSPFTYSLWLDLDCKVNGDLEALFHCLNWNVELALVRDPQQNLPFLLPGEIHYNAGVIAFCRGAQVLQQWSDRIAESGDQFPGDQGFLTRTIHLYPPPLFELSPLYNWHWSWGANTSALIEHYCSTLGKREILKSLYS